MRSPFTLSRVRLYYRKRFLQTSPILERQMRPHVRRNSTTSNTRQPIGPLNQSHLRLKKYESHKQLLFSIVLRMPNFSAAIFSLIWLFGLSTAITHMRRLYCSTSTMVSAVLWAISSASCCNISAELSMFPLKATFSKLLSSTDSVDEGGGIA